MYILYVLSYGARGPPMGPEEAVQPAWPRGQPRKRRLKDPDDVGAARDPFLCVREQFFFESDRGLCLSQGTRSRYL